jgi:hypothetical protein
MSYFTNIAVENINKAFVYITDFTASLNISSIENLDMCGHGTNTLLSEYTVQ